MIPLVALLGSLLPSHAIASVHEYLFMIVPLIDMCLWRLETHLVASRGLDYALSYPAEEDDDENLIENTSGSRNRSAAGTVRKLQGISPAHQVASKQNDDADDHPLLASTSESQMFRLDDYFLVGFCVNGCGFILLARKLCEQILVMR